MHKRKMEKDHIDSEVHGCWARWKSNYSNDEHFYDQIGYMPKKSIDIMDTEVYMEWIIRTAGHIGKGYKVYRMGDHNKSYFPLKCVHICINYSTLNPVLITCLRSVPVTTFL